MIKIDNVEIVGWEAAIRGMRNPKNSWTQSDSDYVASCDGAGKQFAIGAKDLKLMKVLANAGSDHGKFLRMITVYADITAPLYWYKEYDTYKIGTVADSCSTMHKIAAKEFTLDDFSYEHLLDDCGNHLIDTITLLNTYRDKYNNAIQEKMSPESVKLYWWQMIQLLPSSYNQRRTVQLNYAVLRNMYHARKYHKLDEWRDFCAWVETLPYAELITGENNE